MTARQRIARMRIAGFKRLFDFDLEMRDFMVMAGANGVGKSTVLDAFSLLSAMAGGGMDAALSGMGGVANIVTRGKSDALSFRVDMAIPDHNPLEYSITLSPGGNGYAIAKETLLQVRHDPDNPFIHIESANNDIRYYDQEKRLTRPTWEHNPRETSLAQVPKMFRQPEELRRMLATAAHYHALDVSERAPVKLPQAVMPAVLPGKDGENLVSYLYTMRESDPARFQTVLDTLEAAFPDFDGLSFPPSASGMISLSWKSKHYERPFSAHELSEGTLRFLWLAALLQSPDLPLVTLIDEPEVSLHPELLSLLVDLMREASARTQLIVATHSDSLVRFLRPEEFLAMDIDGDGCAVGRWADSMDIDSWLEDYGLDALWKMGRVGGRA